MDNSFPRWLIMVSMFLCMCATMAFGWFLAAQVHQTNPMPLVSLHPGPVLPHLV